MQSIHVRTCVGRGLGACGASMNRMAMLYTLLNYDVFLHLITVSKCWVSAPHMP